jgi:transmembrane sensor
MSKPSAVWNDRDYLEACEWFVEFRTSAPDAPRREAFHAWLQQSPAHMGAYLEATAVWNQTAMPVPRPKYSIDALVAAAAEDRDNVSFLGRISKTGGQGTRTRRGVFGAVATLVALIATGYGVLVWRASDTYSTAIGEQRSVVLKDGSIIELNSRSTVHVRYSERARRIELSEGQALFKVAHDTTRPFVVSAGSAAVRAVGTQFDVNRLHTETVVTVLEGKVAVQQPSLPSTLGSTGELQLRDANREKSVASPTSDSALVVAAGEQLRVSVGGAVERSRRPDIAAATAWTQRRLVFEATPLADVVEQFNRYNPRPLLIRSSELEAFQIDGVFSSTDPMPIIRFLRSRPGIEVTETGTAIEISAIPSRH